MKNFLFLIAIVLTTLTSCTFTENMTIAENGSGKYSVDMDGATLMSMAGDQLAASMGEKQPKNIDTTFTFKQLFVEKKDSIAKLPLATQQELKKLENVVVNMKMNAENKVFLLKFNNDFKSVSELQDVMKTLQTLQKIDSKSGGDSMGLGNGMFSNNSDVTYSYAGKTFSRKATLLPKENNKAQQDSLGMNKMIFASSNYVLKYNFPKRIKKVSNPNALFSEDKKSLTIQYPFTDYMEHPEKLDLIVEFE
ncbi:hypothetical protein [Flavobacterium agrisoli]|uniref:Lipoprotein n=1 Tax=Flavobacterium agrisoli TaxID=2793066 RepID=A0A934PPC6_9FLAO|nr:hypothetical protein [Flavobacterium agrisoli]MBK0370459.1 hypothetical protein [Flavobacterium agrisoli]